MTDASRLRATIYVSGLDDGVDEDILADVFLPFGDIVGVTIPKSENAPSREHHRGFGYVEYEVAADAEEAIENMDQGELFGRTIKVAHAKPQKDSTEGLGSKQAIWTEENYLVKHGVHGGDNIKVEQSLRTDLEDSSEPTQNLTALGVAGPIPAE